MIPGLDGRRIVGHSNLVSSSVPNVVNDVGCGNGRGEKPRYDQSGKEKALVALMEMRRGHENGLVHRKDRKDSGGDVSGNVDAAVPTAVRDSGGGINNGVVKKKGEKRVHGSMSNQRGGLAAYGKDGNEYCNGTTTSTANGRGHHHHHHHHYHHHKGMKKKNGFVGNRLGANKDEIDNDIDVEQQKNQQSGNGNGNGESEKGCGGQKENNRRVDETMALERNGNYQKNSSRGGDGGTGVGNGGKNDGGVGGGGGGNASSNSQIMGGMMLNGVAVGGGVGGSNRPAVSSNGVSEEASNHHHHHHKRTRR